MGKGGCKFTLENIVRFVNNSKYKKIKNSFFIWYNANNISLDENVISEPSKTIEEESSVIDEYNEVNSIEESSISDKLIEEKINLINLKKELAELVAKIEVSELQIQYYELLLMKGENV